MYFKQLIEIKITVLPNLRIINPNITINDIQQILKDEWIVTEDDEDHFLNHFNEFFEKFIVKNKKKFGIKPESNIDYGKPSLLICEDQRDILKTLLKLSNDIQKKISFNLIK